MSAVDKSSHDPAASGNEDKLKYENDFLSQLNLGPHPIFRNGKWEVKELDFDRSVVSFHSYTGLETDERDEVLENLTETCMNTIKEAIIENQVPHIFADYDEQTQHILRSNLDVINHWRVALQVDSSLEKFKADHSKISRHLTEFVTAVAHRVAETHPEREYIVTNVRPWDEYPLQTQRCLRAYIGTISDSEREEILARATASVLKPSVWVLVGSSVPDPQTDSESNKAEFAFGSSCDCLWVPSIHSAKNDAAEKEIGEFISSLQASISKRLGQTSETLRMDLDVGANRPLGGFEESAREWALTQYQTLEDREVKLVRTTKDLVQSMNERCEDIDVHVLSSRQYHGDHARYPTDKGFIHWGKIADKLEQAYEDAARSAHHRQWYNSIVQWGEHVDTSTAPDIGTE